MRVGFWRLRKMLGQVGAKPTVTLNARVCETYPEVVEACVENGWELPETWAKRIWGRWQHILTKVTPADVEHAWRDTMR